MCRPLAILNGDHTEGINQLCPIISIFVIRNWSFFRHSDFDIRHFFSLFSDAAKEHAKQ